MGGLLGAATEFQHPSHQHNMSAPLHAKILVIGPQKCGKTAIVNYLANFREMPSEYYHATAGVRIHEFEHTLKGMGKPSFGEAPASVELWDVSGDHKKYKDCWPAIQKDVDGVLFVFDTEVELGPDNDVELWFNEFLAPLIRHGGLSEKQVRACGHSRGSQDKHTHPDRQLPASLPRLKPFRTSLNYPEGSQELTKGFGDLMASVLDEIRAKQERLESSIGA